MRRFIDQIKRYIGDLNRDLGNVFLAIRVYSITLSIVFLIFGVFGIRPLIGVIISKVKVAQELKKDNATLTANIVQYEIIRSQLQENSIYINYLDQYLPVSPSTQAYLLEFVDSVGSVGYSIKSFSQVDDAKEENTTELNIFMDGDRYPSELIKKIEALKRVTKIKRVLYFSDSRLGVPVYTVNMNVQIYHFGDL